MAAAALAAWLAMGAVGERGASRPARRDGAGPGSAAPAGARPEAPREGGIPASAGPVVPDPGELPLRAAREALERDLARANGRIRDLEAELASSRERAEAASADAAFMKRREASSSSTSVKLLSTPEEACDLLGLDASRRSVFLEAFGGIRRRLDALEASRTTREEKGGKEILRIAADPEEIRLLKEEWDQTLSGILVPAEREKHDRLRMGEALFGNAGRPRMVIQDKLFRDETWDAGEGKTGFSRTFIPPDRAGGGR